MTSADLADLFNHHGSNKDRIGYSSLYHVLFHRFQYRPVTLLEVGIQGMPGNVSGSALRAWRDYFTLGRIVGIDTQPHTLFHTEPRIQTYLCDATQSMDVAAFINNRIHDNNNNINNNNNRILNDDNNNYLIMNENNMIINENDTIMFDLIVDSGHFTHTSQLSALTNLWPHLNDGGVYVIENLYLQNLIRSSPRLVTAIVGDHVPMFFSGGVHNNQCVLVKSYLNTQTINF